MKERHLYRLETVDVKTGKSLCGFVKSVTGFFATNYGAKDAEDMFKLQDKLLVKSPERMLMISFFYTLDGLTIPEIYIKNANDYVCLYTKTGFQENHVDICAMAVLYHRLVPDKEIRYKEFHIPYDEIVFKEKNQVVITWETYKKYRDQNNHKKLIPVFFDSDFDIFTPLTKNQSPAG